MTEVVRVREKNERVCVRVPVFDCGSYRVVEFASIGAKLRELRGVFEQPERQRS